MVCKIAESNKLLSKMKLEKNEFENMRVGNG